MKKSENKILFSKELENALKLEQKGLLDDARSLFENIIKRYPSEKASAMFEFSKFLFRSGSFDKALDLMIQCHNSEHNKKEIESIIIEAYYSPNIGEFEKQYKNNLSDLKEYASFNEPNTASFDKLKYKFIPFNEKKYAIFDKHSRKFKGETDLNIKTLNINFDSNQIYMIKNEFHIANLKTLEERTRQTHTDTFATTQMPIFWVYDDIEKFLNYLQVWDLTSLLKTERIHLLPDFKKAESFFQSEKAIFPNLFINMGADDRYYKTIENAKHIRLKDQNICYQNLMQMFEASLNASPKR